MLPYRQRPPKYGGKQKRQTRKQSSTSFHDRTVPYRQGGPLQRAVKADLLALLPQFQDKLAVEASSSSSVDGDDTTTTGTAFSAFKSVFASAKVALLHRSGRGGTGSNGFLPQKCDRNAYSQLLYAVCLSMLKDALVVVDEEGTEEEDEDHNSQVDGLSLEQLQHAAFAVFLLYALYETNPLPAHDPNNPGSSAEILSQLPMGVINREDSRAVYRRSYRQPIRIDILHYSYLMRLRDLAMAAAVSATAASRTLPTTSSKHTKNKSSGETSTRSEDEGDDGPAWKRNLALDTIQVVDRVLCVLELAAYTGPCSLEGLVGHADYPYPSAQVLLPTTSRTNVTTEANSGTNHPPPVDTALQPTESTTISVFSSDLEQHLTQYLEARNEIRLPPENKNISRQDRRIRETLLPMFPAGWQVSRDSSREDDPVARLLSVCRGEEEVGKTRATTEHRIRIRHRHVTFEIPVARNEEAMNARATPGDNMSAFKESSHDGGIDAGSEDKNQESIDLELPAGLSAELEASIRQGIEVLMDREGSFLSPFGGAKPQSTGGDQVADGVSTLGSHGVSAAGSTVTGPGRRALRDLLSQAKKTQMPETNSPRRPYMQTTGDLFFASESAALANNGQMIAEDVDETSNLSDLSSSEDEVSVAVSRVGQREMDRLLKFGGRKSRRSRPTKTSPSQRFETKPRQDSSAAPGEANPVLDGDSLEDKSASSSRAGQHALERLLETGGGKKRSRPVAKSPQSRKRKQPTISRDQGDTESNSHLGNDRMSDPAHGSDGVEDESHMSGASSSKPNARRLQPTRASNEMTGHCDLPEDKEPAELNTPALLENGDSTEDHPSSSSDGGSDQSPFNEEELQGGNTLEFLLSKSRLKNGRKS